MRHLLWTPTLARPQRGYKVGNGDAQQFVKLQITTQIQQRIRHVICIFDDVVRIPQL
jgi:hypothetical protein